MIHHLERTSADEVEGKRVSLAHQVEEEYKQVGHTQEAQCHLLLACTHR